MSKVSIICPVYGVESYVERCAKSLFEQSFSDIEYIFVNDCTKDNSMVLLRALIKKYRDLENNVRLIDLDENRGLPNARKVGFEASTGDYVIFCDTDDFIELNMVACLYNKAIETGAECVLCDYYETFGKETIIKRVKTGDDSLHQLLLLLYNKIPGFIWRGIYSRTLVEKLQLWPRYNFGEDIVCVSQLWTMANMITHVDMPLYHYCLRNDSLSMSKSFESIQKQVADCVYVVDVVSKYLLNVPEYEGKLGNAINYFKHSLIASRFSPYEKYCNKDYRVLYKNTSKSNVREYLTDGNISLKEKILFALDVLNILPLYFYFKKLLSTK